MKQISTLLLALALPICASATVLMPKSGIITKSPVKSLIAVEASDFATNAGGRTAKIKVNWSAGVEDITADKAEGVRKVIENGRIVILKDGHKYNTLGIEVK